jgi:CheY-like chemotaxis protein
MNENQTTDNVILLVEDNEMNRDMLSRRLIKRGYSVKIAVNGKEAIEMASDLLPQLILMDLSLPLIDGWEATRQIKASELTQHIPIIALTAHAMSNDKQKAMEAGCNDYDTKPIDLARLIDKMNKLLQH